MSKAYEGQEPYIFISYSHKDQEEVKQYIEALQSREFRVWYDGGIEAGSEWPEYIANHLANCKCVIAFISSNFAESNNCRQELSFAQNQKKDVLSVYIEEANLPYGLQMQLGLYQALHKINYQLTETFIESLCDAKLIQPCKVEPKEEAEVEAEVVVKLQPEVEVKVEAKAEPKTEPTVKIKAEANVEPKLVTKVETKTEAKVKPKQDTKVAAKVEPEAEAKPESKPNAKSEPKKQSKPRAKKETKTETPFEKEQRLKFTKKCRTTATIGSILELLYIPLSFFLLKLLTGMDIGIGKLFLIMIIPHTCIAIINKILFSRTRKKIEKANVKSNIMTDSAGTVWLVTMFSCLVAAIGGMFFLQMEMFFLLKLLLSIGVNVLPSFIALLMSALSF